MLNLKPSPLGNRGLCIDEKYCDGQLRYQTMVWFLKVSVNNENAHLMRFVEKYNATPHGVPSKDKISFEEYH